MTPRSNRKTSTWSAVNFKKHLTSMSCKLEFAIWSLDPGQRMPCFPLTRCQLIITWCPISKQYTVNQGCMSLSTYYLEYGSHLARLLRRRRAYAPTSNTASHDNHEKINSWVSFCFLYEYGAPFGGPSGRRSSAKNNFQSWWIKRDYGDRTVSFSENWEGRNCLVWNDT